MDRKAPSTGGGRNIVAVLMLVVVTLAVVAAMGVAGYLFYLMARLPKVDRLADYKPPIVSQVTPQASTRCRRPSGSGIHGWRSPGRGNHSQRRSFSPPSGRKWGRRSGLPK